MAGMIDVILIVVALASAGISLFCLRTIRALISRIPAATLPFSVDIVETSPESSIGPEAFCVLPTANDEVLADLEELERSSRGASTSAVCTHWDEQDERDAVAEDVALAESRAMIRRLPVRYH